MLKLVGIFRVFLNLCKNRYLNMTTFVMPVLLLMKSWTFWYTENAFLRHHMQELWTS